MRIVLDIETCGLPNAADYLEPVTPDARLKDPDKIAADIKAKEAARAERLALDWNVGRIVAIGWWCENKPQPTIWTAKDEAEERKGLDLFWQLTPRQIVGFYIRPFDLPFIIQRSRLLDVPHHRINLARYRREPVCDLFDELTFDDVRSDGCMKRTLKAFCRRFGIDVPDDDGDGNQVAAWVQAGEWDRIGHHLRRDLERTKALAQRLGYFGAPRQQQVA